MARDVEDNRDVFEKALEKYAPLVGTVLGALGGRSAFNKGTRSVVRRETLRNPRNVATLAGAGAGYTAGSFPRINEEGKRRK